MPIFKSYRNKNIFILLIITYFYLSSQKNIKSGVYTILFNEQYLFYSNRKIYISPDFGSNSLFRIKKESKNINDSLYFIGNIQNSIKLGVSNNKELKFISGNYNFHPWNFFNINDNEYIIRNINNCYVIVDNSKVLCEDIPEYKATKFKLIKIYNEVNLNGNSINNSILEREPIDILIKYIDLRDPDLNRNEIHQISKDYDNEELRYSLRSIFENISWIRKIFILMPNKKVRFLKDYNLIKDKIVYINDKEFLGYDSSNYNAFLFRYWKMKKFGISDNIIVMDDDCFIGNKLEKSDFFYVKDGKVIPSIVTSNFIKIEPKFVQENFELFEKKVKNNKEEQGGDEFNYSKYLTFSFILKLFNTSSNESIFIPKFTHNAIPVNLNDVKEIYKLVYKSKYKYNTLECLYRIAGYLQFQIFILSYTFLKYNRRVHNIPNTFVQIYNSISSKYNYSLLCINTGAGNISYLSFYKARITMEYLFPFPSPYEIIDYSFSKIAFKLSSSMEESINSCKKRNSQISKKNEFHKVFLILIIFIFILIFLKIKYSGLYIVIIEI